MSRKLSRKSLRNFYQYIEKIEAQAQNWYSHKKMFMENNYYKKLNV